MSPYTPWPRATATFLNERLSRIEAACREASVPFYDDAGVDDHLQRVLLASDFAYACCLRDPGLLGPDFLQLMSDPRHADARAGVLGDVRDEAALRQVVSGHEAVVNLVAILHGTQAAFEKVHVALP